MSLTRKIAHNTLIQLVGKIISTGLGIAAVAIMTRALGTEKFGWYITATGFLQFVGILSDFGFTVTTSNMLAETGFGKQKVLDTLFTWRFLTALVFQGLAPLIFLFFPYRAEIKIAVAITSVSFFALTVIQVFVGYYRERLRLAVVVIGDILSRVILVAGVGLVALKHWGFLPIMVVISLASLATMIYYWWKIEQVRLAIDWKISRVLFTKIWPTAISVICNACYLQADRVILPLFVAQTTVGLYGASYRVLDIVIQVAALIMGMIMPLITYAWSRGLKKEFAARYQLGFDLLALLLLPMIAGIALLATPIMQLIAGRAFAPAGPILRLLSVSIFGTCFGMIFGHVALAINRQREALWIYFSDAVLSLIGYWIFIPRYGVFGAIGVTIFSEFYAGIGLTILTVYYVGLAPRLGAFFKIVLASLFMGAVLYLLPPYNVLLRIVIGGASYTAAILALRVISRQTIREILTLKEGVAISVPTETV